MLVADVVVIFWTWRSSRRFLKVVVTQHQMERKKILQAAVAGFVLLHFL